MHILNSVSNNNVCLFGLHSVEASLSLRNLDFITAQM